MDLSKKELLAVSGRDDVRLDRVFRRVGGIAGDEASLVEGPGAQVGAAAGLAAVAAVAEDDRALEIRKPLQRLDGDQKKDNASCWRGWIRRVGMGADPESG